MFDLNPYVEEYASGEDDWRQDSNGKSFVRFFVRVLRALDDQIKLFMYFTWIGVQVS